MPQCISPKTLMKHYEVYKRIVQNVHSVEAEGRRTGGPEKLDEPNKLTKSNTFILLFKIIFHWIQSAELKADRSSEKDKIKLVRCNYPNCHKVKKINT